MNVLEDLWDNKPLLITVLVAVVAVVFLLHGAANKSSAISTPASGDGSGTVPGGSGLAGTYVDESYLSNTYTTTSIAPPISTPAFSPSILKPAPKGTLGTKGAGKSDTNFWVYTVPTGATLTSLAQFARWGSDYSKLANYRNNADILKAAGVDTSNPYATVPTGLQLSV